MKKVLIIGPDFFNYNQSIERAFNKLNFETRVLSYSPGEVISLKDKIEYYSTRNKGAFFDKVKEKFNKQIIDLYKSFQPELVFVIQGNYVFKSTVESMQCKKVLWMMDSIYRAKGAYDLRNNIDFIFVFEKTDIDRLWQSDKIEAHFLPLAVDETVYYPMPAKSEIDILFVGNLYQKRMQLLERISDRFKDKVVRIYGRYFSPFKNPVRQFFRRNKNVFLNENLHPSEVNAAYNKSKICLNIHHDQSQYGVNQRFFEISGSKAFQIVDNNPFVKDNFANDEIMTYSSEEDLAQKIERVLNEQVDTQSMKEKAYNKILANHTFGHRIKEVLGIVRME